MSKSYIPLSKWLIAIYLFCTSRGNIASAELSRLLNLPYKTAWALHERIKKNHKGYNFNDLAGLI